MVAQREVEPVVQLFWGTAACCTAAAGPSSGVMYGPCWRNVSTSTNRGSSARRALFGVDAVEDLEHLAVGAVPAELGFAVVDLAVHAVEGVGIARVDEAARGRVNHHGAGSRFPFSIRGRLHSTRGAGLKVRTDRRCRTGAGDAGHQGELAGPGAAAPGAPAGSRARVSLSGSNILRLRTAAACTPPTCVGRRCFPPIRRRCPVARRIARARTCSFHTTLRSVAIGHLHRHDLRGVDRDEEVRQVAFFVDHRQPHALGIDVAERGRRA